MFDTGILCQKTSTRPPRPKRDSPVVEGQDIRAVEGVVVLRNQEKLWQVEVRKTSKGYPVELRDIVVGLVRPERRNIGFMSQSGTNVFASSDGVAIVREKSELAKEYPIEWIFHVLRTEACRIQFWTESGGTSYGKLNLEQIRSVLLPKPSADEIARIAGEVRLWSKSVASSSSMFENLWVSNDRVAILNSPLIGLEADQSGDETGSDEV